MRFKADVVWSWPLGLALASLVGSSSFAIDVSQPEVSKGITELRQVNTAAWSDHDPGSPRHLHEFHIGYGFTDELALKLIMSIEGAHGEDTHAALGAGELTYELVDIESGGIGLAWYTLVDVAIDDQASNDVVFGPIFKFHHGHWDFVINTNVVQTFGNNETSGAQFAYAWQAVYEISPHLRLGVEGDGGMDNMFHLTPLPEQEHRIGPALFTEFHLGDRVITLDLGVQFGVTDPCADTEGKLIVGTTF